MNSFPSSLVLMRALLIFLILPLSINLPSADFNHGPLEQLESMQDDLFEDLDFPSSESDVRYHFYLPPGQDVIGFVLGPKVNFQYKAEDSFLLMSYFFLDLPPPAHS